MTEAPVKKDLPVGTILELSPGQIVLKLELGDTETTATYKTTQKVDEFLSNPKYAKNYHRGACVEFSAHNGVVSLVRPAKGFVKATEAPKQPTASVQPQVTGKIVPMDVVAQSASTFVAPIAKPSAPIQQLSLSGEAVNVSMIGPFDPNKVKSFKVKATCNLGNFENISIEVETTDIDTARIALMDGFTQFGRSHELTRDAIQNFIKRVFLKDMRV